MRIRELSIERYSFYVDNISDDIYFCDNYQVLIILGDLHRNYITSRHTYILLIILLDKRGISLGLCHLSHNS